MLGPKQFEIGHKVKPRRDLDNPIVTRIFTPKFKGREDDLRSMLESFADKFKMLPFEFDEAEIKPLAKNMPFQREKVENQFKTSSGSFLDRFNPNKQKEVKPKDKEEKPEEISEELVNRLTYQVFQNIQRYLNNDMKESGSRRHIKIDISI